MGLEVCIMLIVVLGQLLGVAYFIGIIKGFTGWMMFIIGILQMMFMISFFIY